MKRKYGITGVSELYKLLRYSFDMINDFVVDPMHNIFLGVVKKLALFWFSKKYNRDAFNLSRRIREVDAVIREISTQVPHEFTRPPRAMERNMVHYKGWKKFVVVYIIFVWLPHVGHSPHHIKINIIHIMLDCVFGVPLVIFDLKIPFWDSVYMMGKLHICRENVYWYLSIFTIISIFISNSTVIINIYQFWSSFFYYDLQQMNGKTGYYT